MSLPANRSAPNDDHPSAHYRRGPHWVAIFAAVFTWPLIFVGGLVTTYRVGMAVPDWPTTFGMNMFIYKFWDGAWGVFVEHGHRLYGAAVGLATIVLMIWFMAAERRGWLKTLGVFALLAVIGQGFLGGYRVRLNSTHLAAVHGCTAQLFFALMVSLCVFTGREWSVGVKKGIDTDHLRRRSTTNLLLIAVQIGIGAWLRHFGLSTALAVHSVLATAVLGHAFALSLRIERRNSFVPSLVPSGRAMGVIVVGQVILGIGAWWLLRPFDGIPRFVTSPQALIRTAHQANGALLLASSVVLTLRSFHHLETPTIETVRASRPATLDLEAVA